MIENDFSLEEREMTLAEVKDALKKFERKYAMPSEEFYEKWRKGQTYHVAESVEWVSIFESYQIMNGTNSRNGKLV